MPDAQPTTHMMQTTALSFSLPLLKPDSAAPPMAARFLKHEGNVIVEIVDGGVVIARGAAEEEHFARMSAVLAPAPKKA